VLPSLTTYFLLLTTSFFLFLSSCQKPEQHRFSGIFDKYDISFEYNGPDSLPALEFESYAKFNKHNSTITIGDTLTFYYTYDPETNWLKFSDTIQINIYNKKVWVVRSFFGEFENHFRNIYGKWGYIFNSYDLYSVEKPLGFDLFIYHTNDWYLSK
jgi:hypothetical protein